MRITDELIKKNGGVKMSCRFDKLLKVNKLRNHLMKKLNSWDERSMFRVGGVKNLSRSDIDTLLLCCDTIEIQGDLRSMHYLSIEIKEVLAHYGLS